MFLSLFVVFYALLGDHNDIYHSAVISGELYHVATRHHEKPGDYETYFNIYRCDEHRISCNYLKTLAPYDVSPRNVSAIHSDFHQIIFQRDNGSKFHYTPELIYRTDNLESN